MSKLSRQKSRRHKAGRAKLADRYENLTWPIGSVIRHPRDYQGKGYFKGYAQ